MALADDYSTASLSFVPKKDSGSEDKPVIPEGNYLFYESFDNNKGTGGNDGLWSGSIASTQKLNNDNEGWTSANDKIYGANKCIKLGTTNYSGTATSPAFTVNGTATLTFKAGAWNTTNDGTTLTVSTSNGSLGQTSFNMTHGDWTNFSTTINANGNVKLTFTTSNQRFFLDEVRVTATATGIASTTADIAKTTVIGYFAFDGTRLQSPRKGVNIVKYADGSSKKIVMM